MPPPLKLPKLQHLQHLRNSAIKPRPFPALPFRTREVPPRTDTREGTLVWRILRVGAGVLCSTIFFGEHGLDGLFDVEVGT
jgi:hypothetical protein